MHDFSFAFFLILEDDLVKLFVEASAFELEGTTLAFAEAATLTFDPCVVYLPFIPLFLQSQILYFSKAITAIKTYSISRPT